MPQVKSTDLLDALTIANAYEMRAPQQAPNTIDLDVLNTIGTLNDENCELINQACKSGNFTTAAIIIKTNMKREDINAYLPVALQENNINFLKILLAAGANPRSEGYYTITRTLPNNTQTERVLRMTALQYAAQHSPKVVQILQTYAIKTVSQDCEPAAKRRRLG